MTKPAKSVVGRRCRRREDRRLITGRASFTDDFDPLGALHVSVVRSTVAHARIVRLDVSAALALPGVVAAIAASDLDRLGVGELPVSWVHPGQRGLSSPLLAREKVLYVGQPIVIVLAEDEYVAEDAAGRVAVEYEPLPVVVDVEAALAEGAPILHEDWGVNELVEAVVEGGDISEAFASAAVLLARRYRVQRQAGSPLEPRAAVADHDRERKQIVLRSSLQGPHYARTVICAVCGWTEDRLRVIAPDVGGGFGVKDHAYPEDVLVCALAERFDRPVKWVEDRREHFLATVHSRQQLWDVELAASEHGEVLGVRGRVIYDIGGHSSNHGIGPARMSADMLLGPYAVANYRMEVVGAVTNKVPIGAYRGFGSPQATFVMERLMDTLAARLGRDRAQLRRQNMIREHPCTTPAGYTYDSGDYVAALDRALELLKRSDACKPSDDAHKPSGARSREDGRHCCRGIGIASFVQPAGLAPSKVLAEAGVAYGSYESVTVRIGPDGRASVLVPTPSQGQGHATTLAQVCAEQLGLDHERDISVVQGDTARTPYSPAGAVGSRVASIAGAAVLRASERVAGRLRSLAADILEASEADIELVDGAAVIKGTPARRVPIPELARRTYSSAPFAGDAACAEQDGASRLEESETYDPAASTFPYGTHAALVEIDRDTGAVSVLRYVVVSDCGVLLNPTIVEGQIIGGVAQGIGGAVLEELVYDDGGQLLTASFMDYLLPTAAEVPSIEIEHMEIPAPDIPGGAKGAGEAGTLAPAAVLASAVSDALGVEITELPLGPETIWRLAAGMRGRDWRHGRRPRSDRAAGAELSDSERAQRQIRTDRLERENPLQQGGRPDGATRVPLV